jgi:Protein of unknown function (DUF2637)
MSNYAVSRDSGSADLHSKLRLAALGAVMLGVVLLAAAAFVLSYEGIHQIALRAGASPGLAKLYPLIFDAMLVIAGAAALALRGASWWARLYAWAVLIVLLVAVATGNALHATNTALPAQPARVAVAVAPWLLLLAAFGLMLELLRHFRTTRAPAAAAMPAGIAIAGSGSGNGDAAAPPAGTGPAAARRAGTAPIALPAGNGTTAPPADVAVARPAEAGDRTGTRPAVTWAGTPRADGGSPAHAHTTLVDLLLGPRTSQPPAVGLPDETGQQDDPVSYGAETGYVHPDSYRDEGEYSPHGDSGGPQLATATGPEGGELPTDATDPAEAVRPGPAPESGPAGEQGQGEATAQAEGTAQGETTAQAEGTAQGEAVAQGEAASQAKPTEEPPGTEGPELERMRSTPTRPEE